MELKCAYTLIVIFVFSKIAILTSLQVKWGNFQVLHKHPGIKKCAIAVLKKRIGRGLCVGVAFVFNFIFKIAKMKGCGQYTAAAYCPENTNDLVGGRVSKLTGLCEGLQYAQGVNQTIQSGYAYVKKIYVQENYQPPAILSVDRTDDTLAWWYWWIPGVLSTGTKVEVTVTLVPGLFFFLVDSLETLGMSDDSGISLPTADGMNGLLLTWLLDTFSVEELTWGNRTNLGISPLLKQMDTNTKHAKLRLSFEMLTNELRVLVAGEEMLTWAPEYLDMITIRQMVINTPLKGTEPISVFGFEFSAA